MKRANGRKYYKVRGTRRKPYVVRVTIGWDSTTGKQIRKTIGY